MQYILIVAAVVGLIGIIPYVLEVLNGTTQPNRVTWLLWALAPLIGAFAALSDGVTWAVLPVFIAGFGPLLVLVFSFVNKHSYWEIKKFDYVCGFSSVIALIVWGITNQPELAILLAIISDGLAAIPTLIKAFKYPETENAGPFISGLSMSIISLFAIDIWNFSTIAFPIYLVTINVFLVSFICQKNILSLKTRVFNSK